MDSTTCWPGHRGKREVVHCVALYTTAPGWRAGGWGAVEPWYSRPIDHDGQWQAGSRRANGEPRTRGTGWMASPCHCRCRPRSVGSWLDEGDGVWAGAIRYSGGAEHEARTVQYELACMAEGRASIHSPRVQHSYLRTEYIHKTRETP